nr:GSCFA domain-containing protein [candidate division Zixibacteria bacterium]
MEKTAQSVTYRQGDDIERAAHRTWYRGGICNFIASKQNMREPQAIEKYILKGWPPNSPIISKQSKILAFGSCFARHISEYLGQRGYLVGAAREGLDTYIIRCGAGMVNTFSVLQQLEWAYENRNFSENLWYDSEKELAPYNREIRENTRRLFDQTDIFIITLGLSEVWCNRQTGEVFWRAIPQDKFNPEIHGFRVTTVDENRDNLEKIYSVIKKHRPQAEVIFTLSPVPLVATFRPISCTTANSVSKAILRAALDEFLRQHPDTPDLHYWPSYEIVNNYFSDPYEDDNRHIKPEAVRVIMEMFTKYYCRSEKPKLGLPPVSKNREAGRKINLVGGREVV